MKKKVLMIIALIALVAGRYPRKTFVAFSLIGAAAYAAEIVHQKIAGHFVPEADYAALTMLALFGVIFILSAVFLAMCVRREDRAEMTLRMNGEI